MDEKKRKELMDEHKAIMAKLGSLLETQRYRKLNEEEQKQWSQLFQRDGVIYDELHKKEAPVMEWINVNDKRPEVGQQVVALARGGSVSIMRYNVGGEFVRTFEMRQTMPDGGVTTIEYRQTFCDNVTHWMPLPKNPFRA